MATVGRRIARRLTYMMLPPVSVYVPCYNVARYIERVLFGLLTQEHRPDEILIIDDGTPDNTIEIAQKYPVTIIRHDRNRGLSAARNTAFHAARNEWVAAVDADVVATPNWLQLLAEKVVEQPYLTGLMGCLIEGNQEKLADRYRTIRLAQNWGTESISNPPFLFGANTMFRKSAVLAVGGFEEKYRTNGEDVLMSQKLYRAGAQLFYHAQARALHLREDNVDSVLRMMWQHLRHPAVLLDPPQTESDVVEFLRKLIHSNFRRFEQQALAAQDWEALELDYKALARFCRMEWDAFKNSREATS